MKSTAYLLRVVLAAGLLLAIPASRSVAAVVTYTSSADFFAALGASPSVTEGYEALPNDSLIPEGTTIGGITYIDFPAGTVGSVEDSFNGLGIHTLGLQRATGGADFFLPDESFTVDFTAPVFAVGIFFVIAHVPSNSLLVQTTVGTATTGGPTYDEGTVYFAGLIADTAFATATFGGNANLDRGWAADNLTFAPVPTAVPEPTTLALLSLGVAGLGFSRRK